MTNYRDEKRKSLAEIEIDPEILAKELALEAEVDPLEQIDKENFPK